MNEFSEDRSTVKRFGLDQTAMLRDTSQACVLVSGYARLMDLQTNMRVLFAKNDASIELDEFQRLTKWWNDLGETKQLAVKGMARQFALGVEEVTKAAF